MKKYFALAMLIGSVSAHSSFADTYNIDPTHSFIDFKIQHLGVSWLKGRFNDISGTFEYDAKAPTKSSIDIVVKTSSIDSNHAERDKHLRGKDFLDTDKHPTASFKATEFNGDSNKGTLKGDLTLHGVTKPVSLEVTKVGEGKDPWGGYRAGFEGTFTIKRSDFGISYNLGPAAESMDLIVSIEGIKK